MSFFSSWLGTGKPARAAATTGGRVTVTAPGFRPQVEALELSHNRLDATGR